MSKLLFTDEPTDICPVCNKKTYANWVDNGFGPYSVQVDPFHCECGWVESAPCKECIKERCYSWGLCEGLDNESINSM